MNALDKALIDSRALASSARIYGAEKGVSDQFASSYGGGIFGDLKKAADNKRRYQRFRGHVHAAINAIAMKAAGQPVVVAQRRTKRKGHGPQATKSHTHLKKKLPMHLKEHYDKLEVLEDDALTEKMKQPNPLQNSWQYTYSFIVNVCLTGWGFIVAEDDGNGGYDYYSLPTTWVTALHDKGPFSEFKIRDPSKPEASAEEPIPGHLVAFATIPNPNDPKGALALAEAQDAAIKIDDQIQASQEVFFENGVFPNVVVTMGTNPHPDGGVGIRPRLSNAQRRQVYGAIQDSMAGVANYGRPAIIDGLIERIDRLQATQNEMGWEKSERTVRSRILSAFGVHPYILAEESPGSYAQAYNVNSLFCERVNTFLRLLSVVQTSLQSKLQKKQIEETRQDADVKIEIYWEPCSPSDPNMELRKWENARIRGDISQTEFRGEVLGLPPDEDKSQDIIGKHSQVVLSVAKEVGAGTITPDQGIAILVALGLPHDVAEDIAGDEPPEPIIPPALQPFTGQTPPQDGEDESDDDAGDDEEGDGTDGSKGPKPPAPPNSGDDETASNGGRQRSSRRRVRSAESRVASALERLANTIIADYTNEEEAVRAEVSRVING